MCEYCNDEWTVRTHIETRDGHEIELDNDNDLIINLDFDMSEEVYIYEDFILLEINFCPWCGRSLE
ncbi:Hypothetical protein FORC57_1249 [Listeria monocytogenes]|uniref:hypothetical protein n=1 Tax=Listeria monocytogenes TaxID=1639 RepID=UPI0005448296|nr:hypothetical protein [Listeria monocytogenes]EIO1327563.1 hypothetical protein [Listeria innocua]AZU53090.1 Hypothetical protein FORC57_1249 [Listeria monocytogenes]EAC9483500.1 hypothetical protein [Listeria monocytogenes]EAD5510588.1 hypothetical protein [Listeria monocytogenes]EAF2924613.1 hypothetical protein [Listeria monocytogenes]